MLSLNVNQRQKIAEVKPHRTSMEDLSEKGYELSEDHLRLVAGGMKFTWGVIATYSSPDKADVDGNIGGTF